MAKKFVDKDNLEQILESIDEKYLDKNEYESQIRDLKTPTDHSLKFIKNGNIVHEFDGSEDVNLDISSFGGSGDGRDGISKFTSYVFCKTLNGIKPEPPIGGEFFNPYPSGPVDKDGYVIWKDVPTGNGTTYISKRIFSSDGNHGEWSTPSLWQDDKEFRIEYSNDYTPGINSLPNFQNFYESYDNIENLEDKASEAEKQWRLYCKNNGYGTWEDNVIDPLYMATCSLSNGQWSDWTVSKIKGENGIASFESVVYKRSFNKPGDQLEGGDYNNPYPNNYNELGWSTDIPTGLGRLWRSHRLFISDGSGDNAWSDIQLWQDYSGFQVEYSTDFDMTKTLPNFDNFYQSSDTELVAEQTWRDYCENNNLGTWGDSTDNAKYMATCSLKDGSWTDWTVTRIKGESSNHLELSNEFDQIYVIDNKPIEDQSWLTTISYFEGSTKVNLDLSEVEISVPDGFQSTINGNNLEISLTGEPTITDDIKISIKYNDHEKTLLLKRFEGNIDYDLYASSTFYKCDSTGKVTSNDIDVYIISKEVGKNSKTVEITSIDNLDFKLVYKGISNNIIEDLLTITTGEIIDLTKEKYLSNEYDSIRLELYKGEQLLDLINIEKLIDGKDGKDGTSINVKGTVGAESELPIPPENPSDCYILGENLYVWDGSEWVNVGKFTGANGNTPYIGENGNWWIGDEDTGIKAEGKDGINGVAGKDGVSIIWHEESPVHPENPVNGYAYYNTEEKASYVYQDNTWYQMTNDGIDGVNGKDGNDGLSIVWKGDLSSAPENPELNWCYRDTDNKIVYIYNGIGWELLIADGNDGNDGAPGQNGYSVYVTYHDNEITNPPSPPTGNGSSNGWHTDPTSDSKWISQKVSADAENGEWGEPIRLSGDDGNTPYIGENGNWWIGDEDTGIKAKGEDGINGISSFLSTVFIRSYNTPASPSGGSYDSPQPDDNDWSDSIPAGSLPLWSSHRTFSSDGNHGEWSDPILLADSYHFQVEYGKENVTTSLANFGSYYNDAKGDISIAETNWRLEHDGWSDSTEDAFYMATCSKTGNNTWSDWLVTQIKGEKGDAGQFTEFRYHPSGYYSKAPALNIKEANPSGWSTTMLSTPAAPYIWMTQSIKSGDGEELIKDWSYPSLVTIPGKDGSSESGLAKIPYYAGVVIDSKTYKTTDHTTPYVTTSKGEAYVLIAESAYGSEREDTTKWALMEQYQALFAELAIIDNGTLGSAVFYKDFMYSKIGISGNEVITADFAPYDSSGNKKSIDTIITDSNRPSYLVDLKTGEGYYAGGVIKFNKDSAQLGKFIVDSNGFTYAEQGSWGYESNTNKDTVAVTSLRIYCPNATTINVNLKNGKVPYGIYPLEGRINAKKGTTVKFDNGASQSFVVDDNNVLTYLTEPNGTSDYTVKVINNIKYVNVNTGTQLVKYTLKFNIGETAFDSIYVDPEDASDGIIDKIPCWINCYNGTGTNVNDTIFYNDQDAQLSKAGDYYIIELQVSNPIGSFELWLKGKDGSSWLYPSIFNGPMPAKFDSNIMTIDTIIEDFN